MTDAAQHGQTDHVPAKDYHHGRSPAAWAGVSVASAGMLVGSIGMIPHINWIVFGIGAVLFVAGGLIAVALRKLGLGAD